MQINVSQLLKEPIGSERDYDISGRVDIAGNGKQCAVRGEAKMLRTHRGALVEAELETEVELLCSRCLQSFLQKVTLKIEEEYIPVIDVVTGVRLSAPEDPGSFLIDEHHVIDLTEAVRQYALLAVPMKPLCYQDCAGLCPGCGKNLNRELCQCPEEVIDPRWSELLKLLR